MSNGYVRLKHALADLALDVIVHRRRARTADALLAYAEISSRGEAVPLAALAGRRVFKTCTSMTPAGVHQALLRTGLFAAVDTGKAVALAAPLQPLAPYFYRQVTRLGEARRLLEGSCPRGVSGEIWRAAAMFNAGLFFECHEYLEDAWRAAREPERTFFHGLVQAAAACYHLEKGNLHGARTLAGKAIEKLRPYVPVHQDVDVSGLLAGLDGARAAMDAVPPRLPAGRGDLPVMRLVEGAG